jgi:hypothetical protein
MPYSFSTRHKTLAVELGALRKLAKARRLASATSINRMMRRIETSTDTGGDAEPPPVRALGKTPHRPSH